MIVLDHVSFQYEHSSSTIDIHLQVRRGECVVLVGPSGSGKTTITRLMNGLIPFYYRGVFRGSVTVDGQDVTTAPLWERSLKIGSVFQDPKSQFFAPEIFGEVAFSCENYGLPHEEIVERTNEAIQRFHLTTLRDRPLDLLSSGQKQRTAIASVYALKPEIFVCDEPTANLDMEGTEELKRILKSLKDEGYTIIVSEHRIHWLMDFADRFVYIDQGQCLWEKSADEMRALDAQTLRNYGLRSTVTTELDVRYDKPQQEPWINVEELSWKKGKTRLWGNVSFPLYQGEITAVTGMNGIGKTTFSLVLAGLLKATGGRISCSNKKFGMKERRKKFWYGSNDTNTQFFTDKVLSEILLGSDPSAQTIARAKKLLEQLNLSHCLEAHPASLSGGERQRLSIGCGLMSQKEVLIFDEPTSGLDARNMLCIANVLKESLRQGKTIVVVTHDREFIQECCTLVWPFPKE